MSVSSELFQPYNVATLSIFLTHQKVKITQVIPQTVLFIYYMTYAVIQNTIDVTKTYSAPQH